MKYLRRALGALSLTAALLPTTHALAAQPGPVPAAAGMPMLSLSLVLAAALTHLITRSPRK